MHCKVSAAGAALGLLVVVWAGTGCEDPPADGFLELSIVARNEGADDVTQLRVAPTAVHVVWSDSPAGERHVVPLELGEPLVLDLHFVDGVARQKVTFAVRAGFVHQLRLITGAVELFGPVAASPPSCRSRGVERPTCPPASEGRVLARVPSGQQTGIKVEPEDGEAFEVSEGLTTSILVDFLLRDNLIRPPGTGFLFTPTLEATLLRAAESPPTRPGQIVVRFRDDVTAGERAAVIDGFAGAEELYRVRGAPNLFVVHVPVAHFTDGLQHFTVSDKVLFATVHLVLEPTANNPRPPGSPIDGFRAIVDGGVEIIELDPDAGVPAIPGELINDIQLAAAYDAVDVPEAWDRQVGSMSVVVAALDTGFDLAECDVVPNLFLNADEIPASITIVDADGDGIVTFRDLNAASNDGVVLDSNGNGCIDGEDVLRQLGSGGLADDADGPDFSDIPDDLVGAQITDDPAGGPPTRNNQVQDDRVHPEGIVGHGAQAASVLGAVGHNGRLIAGVAWNVRILPVKVCRGTGTGNCSLVMALSEGLAYARAMGADIAYLGFARDREEPALPPEKIQAELDDYERLYRGPLDGDETMLIIAPGDDEDELDCDEVATICTPAELAIDHMLTVVATVALITSPDLDHQSAGMSFGPEVFDLGVPGVGLPAIGPGGQLTTFTGTSAAMPFAAGAAALARAQFETSVGDPRLLRSRLLNCADAVAPLQGRVLFGSRLNVGNALNGTGSVACPRDP